MRALGVRRQTKIGLAVVCGPLLAVALGFALHAVTLSGDAGAYAAAPKGERPAVVLDSQHEYHRAFSSDLVTLAVGPARAQETIEIYELPGVRPNWTAGDAVTLEDWRGQATAMESGGSTYETTASPLYVVAQDRAAATLAGVLAVVTGAVILVTDYRRRRPRRAGSTRA